MVVRLCTMAIRAVVEADESFGEMLRAISAEQRAFIVFKL